MGQLFWLASYPKSGNTWLRYFLYAYFKLDRGVGDRIDINDPGMAMFSTQDVRFDWWRPFFAKPCQEVRPEEVSFNRRRSQEAIAKATPGAVFVKTHAPYVKDHGVDTIQGHVSAGAIYVIRNPLDVVLSLQDHFGLSSVGKAIQQLNDKTYRAPSDDKRVAQLIGSWSRNVESWVGQKRTGVFALRYEDMLEDPEKAFTYALKTMSREADKAQLDWAIRVTSFDAMAAAEKAKGFPERSSFSDAFFRKGTAGQWRDVLNAGQIKQIVAENHKMMDHCGYLSDDLMRYVPKGARR